MKIFPLLPLLIVFSTQEIAAQKRTELVNDQVAKIQYSVTKKQVIFYIESGGYASVEVDVNGNGKLDKNLDRRYGRTSNWKICTQFLLDEQYSTVCGEAPSKASINIEKDAVIYTIPVSELSTGRKPDSVKVIFWVSVEKDGKWWKYHYPFPGNGFENSYTIKL